MMGDKRSLALAVLMVAVVLSGWQLYQSHRRQAALQEQLLVVQAQLDGLQGELGQLQQELETLEKTTVKGAIREANDAILNSWETLMDTVESELSRARKALEEQQSPPERAPRLESPDGTDST